jgi:hypothetical protein
MIAFLNRRTTPSSSSGVSGPGEQIDRESLREWAPAAPQTWTISVSGASTLLMLCPTHKIPDRLDVFQFLLGPLGWTFAGEILDVAAMILIWRAIGFHPLLLPTFALEFLPVTDLLPAWTGCVALVVALHRKQQAASGQPPAPGR